MCDKCNNTGWIKIPIYNKGYVDLIPCLCTKDHILTLNLLVGPFINKTKGN